MNDRTRNAPGRGTAPQKPYGRAAAIIEPTGTAKDPRFVHIGAVWKTDAGNLKVRIEATPMQWDDPHYPRTILITKTEEPRK